MEAEKPRAKGDLHCPFHQKLMRTVCHKCALWISVVGKNPNTGEQINGWECSFAMIPVLLIENAQQSRAVGAAVESWRNEFVKAEQNKLAIAAPYLVGAAERLEKLNATDNNSQ
jgi:hypothetical protein